MEEQKITEEKPTRPSKIYYKCSVCGVIHDGTDGAPKTCLKCDNDKFYKITKS